jgi:hypothetical protein
VRADLGEPTLGRALEAVEDGAGDRELENAVAEELESLVRGRPILRPGGVREDLRQPIGREVRDEATELLRPGDLGLSPGAR